MAALSSPGYGPIDGQPTAYSYIAVLEVNILNCRLEVRVAFWRVPGWLLWLIALLRAFAMPG